MFKSQLKFLLFPTIIGFSRAYAELNTTNIDINPLGNATPVSLSDSVVTGITAVALAIAPIVIVWGAYHIMTAAGNIERAKSGRQAMLYAGIGLAVVIMARVIAYLVKELFGAP